MYSHCHVFLYAIPEYTKYTFEVTFYFSYWKRLAQKETFIIQTEMRENVLLAWHILEWNDPEFMWDYSDIAFFETTFYKMQKAAFWTYWSMNIKQHFPPEADMWHFEMK